MDFDEYEYLEKTVENPDLPSKEKDSVNGNGVKSEEKDHRSRSSRHRSEDRDRDSDHHRSKKSRSEDPERASSRHRSSPDRRSKDDERNRRRSSRDKEERNGKERDRERERERERRREKEREIERERERDTVRDRRSRSRSERHRDEEREKYREKSKDREYREREREREYRERELESSERDGMVEKNSWNEEATERLKNKRYKEKKEEVAEPEADPERDQRTVFAYQICLKADERDVYEFFSRAGKVRDVRLIMDRNSRRSKGVGYIEFYDAMSVPMAIALSGQPLLGQPVMVKPSEAEKNLVQSTTAAAGAGGLTGPYSGGARRLYVGNLHFNITEDQLRQVFEPFGAVELVQLPLDPETGHCKGFGFIQFARLEDARAAQSLNGQLEIAGRIIKVSAVTDQVGMQDVGANAGDFDDDEGGGLSLNARSRALLMQKLDRSGVAPSVAGALVSPAVTAPALPLPASSVLGAPPIVAALLQPTIPALAGLQASVLPVASITNPIETIGVPSECLLLKNMFDPSVETEPDFDLDIKEDVQDECSKFGTVKHIFVDKNTAGHVYLRFDSITSAMNAQRALHGRWFAGKMITATFMLPQNYEAKFPTNS